MLEDMTIRKAVEFAAETEDLGTIFYRRMAKKFAKKDKEISTIFNTLADDEVAHHREFTKLLDTIPKDENESSYGDRIDLLKVMARSQFFIGQSGLYRKLDEIKTREDALERALQFEKNAWSFYLVLEDAIGKSDVLSSIIDFERGHLEKLMEYMITGAKMRGLGDTPGAQEHPS